MIAPLFPARSKVEILATLISGKEENGYEQVRETWQPLLRSGDFEKKWRRALHDGVLTGSAYRPVAAVINTASLGRYLRANPVSYTKPDASWMELVFRASPAVYDGRFANNGWLQELPDNITKLAWDNAALLSKSTNAGIRMALLPP